MLPKVIFVTYFRATWPWCLTRP